MWFNLARFILHLSIVILTSLSLASCSYRASEVFEPVSWCSSVSDGSLSAVAFIGELSKSGQCKSRLIEISASTEGIRFIRRGIIDGYILTNIGPNPREFVLHVLLMRAFELQSNGEQEQEIFADCLAAEILHGVGDPSIRPERCGKVIESLRITEEQYLDQFLTVDACRAPNAFLGIWNFDPRSEIRPPLSGPIVFNFRGQHDGFASYNCMQ